MKKAGASTQHLCRGLISPKRQSLERQEEIKPQTPQEQEATDIAFSSTLFSRPQASVSSLQDAELQGTWSSKSKASSPCKSSLENGRKSH